MGSEVELGLEVLGLELATDMINDAWFVQRKACLFNSRACSVFQRDERKTKSVDSFSFLV